MSDGLVIDKGYAFSNLLNVQRTVTSNYNAAIGAHAATMEILDAQAAVVLSGAMVVQRSVLKTFDGRTLHDLDLSVVFSAAQTGGLTLSVSYPYRVRLTDSQGASVLAKSGFAYVR